MKITVRLDGFTLEAETRLEHEVICDWYQKGHHSIQFLRLGRADHDEDCSATADVTFKNYAD